ncbi:hypothetical protein Q4519_06480 [Motilimonas sp. 1_MG-2023]|nr:hypothetical protein [Motilimonas sp. 1_MG-2023]MDO6525328.1 hypothetical protein [Motilimonas sp. 1_MG-2023]
MKISLLMCCLLISGAFLTGCASTGEQPTKEEKMMGGRLLRA